MHSFLPAKEKGVQVDRVYVGSFMTSLEMAGVSITLLHLDETRAHCLGESCLILWNCVLRSLSCKKTSQNGVVQWR